MPVILDNAITYQDGEHVEEFHIIRAEKETMNREEENSFWYHVEQCKGCQEKISNFLKIKNGRGGRKPA